MELAESKRENKQNEDDISQQLTIDDVLKPLKRIRLNSNLTISQSKKENDNIKIFLKDQPSIDKGHFNLPKEVIEEAVFYKHNVLFKTRRDSGKQIYYYECADPQCFYRMRIKENPDKAKTLTSSTLISNFKNFDLSVASELSEGICFLTEYGEHKDDHNTKVLQDVEFEKRGSNNVQINY